LAPEDAKMRVMRADTPSRLEPIETASRDEIAALQLFRLKHSLAWSYERVPHTRAKFDAAGVHPDDLKELADLARFPFTTKQDLRETYPFGMFAVPMDDIVRIHASSGTTGKPTVVGYTANDIETWTNIMARSLRAGGATRADIIHITHGYGLFTGGLGVHYGAERLGCAVVPISGGQTERQVQLIQDFKATMIVGTPSYVLNIVDEMERMGVAPRSTTLERGMFGAEPWGEAMRAELQGRLGIAAMDLYGLSEVMGPGVAAECIESRDGPVIWEDHFYPEIIDPETGAVLPEGSAGELVFTSLTKQALPIVRYRTRDLTRLLPPTARSFRRIGKITGRSDDMLIIRGVNVFPSQIEEQILKIPKLSTHYLLEVSRQGHMDELDVLVEAKPDVISVADKDAAAQELRHHIKALIGINTRVHIRDTGSIERSQGKAKRVVDKRPKD
jgi:phenylacetate-CoA ligase